MARPDVPQPDRHTGLPPGVQVGRLGRRFVAYLVDHLVPALIALFTLVLPARGAGDGSTSSTALGWVLIGLWALVVWWMFATRAAGPGMRLMKLQLVGFTNGRPIGWGRFLLRALVLGVLTASGLGLLLMLIMLFRHPRHQGWHDRAANAVVIRQRALAPRSVRTSGPAAKVTAGSAASPTSSKQPPAQQPVGAPGGATVAAVADLGRPAAAGSDRNASTDPGTTASTPVTEQRDSRPLWTVVLDDGREIDVRGLVVLGRKPEARPGEEAAELIKLSDETRTVSKSHLSLDVGPRGLVVTDRGSTNGSTVTAPEGAAQRCTPWEPVQLTPGAVVSMGNHWLKVQQGRRGAGPVVRGAAGGAGSGR